MRLRRRWSLLPVAIIGLRSLAQSLRLPTGRFRLRVYVALPLMGEGALGFFAPLPVVFFPAGWDLAVLLIPTLFLLVRVLLLWGGSPVLGVPPPFCVLISLLSLLILLVRAPPIKGGRSDRGGFLSLEVRSAEGRRE